jgi:hypothetical protein
MKRPQIGPLVVTREAEGLGDLRSNMREVGIADAYQQPMGRE